MGRTDDVRTRVLNLGGNEAHRVCHMAIVRGTAGESRLHTTKVN